jgi:hypothetical protein
MRNFVLRQNIKRFERALATCDDPVQRKILIDLLEKARRELASLPDDRLLSPSPPQREN